MMCDKCDGSGLISLRRKDDNSVVPFSWTYCECYEPKHEYLLYPKPSDYDFPMSETYRAWTYQHCGIPDLVSPHSVEKEPVVETRVILRRLPVDTKVGELENRIEQLEGMKQYLIKKQVKKPKPKYD